MTGCPPPPPACAHSTRPRTHLTRIAAASLDTACSPSHDCDKPCMGLCHSSCITGRYAQVGADEMSRGHVLGLPSAASPS